MYEIGRICVKLAGRDAGGEAIIVDILDDKFVLIDGNVRRRKCNIIHLEPTAKQIKIKKKASHDEIKKEFGKIGLPVWETKQKKAAEKPGKKRKKKQKQVKEEKPRKEKKEAKKTGKKAEVKKAKKEAKPKTKKPADKKTDSKESKK